MNEYTAPLTHFFTYLSISPEAYIAILKRERGVADLFMEKGIIECYDKMRHLAKMLGFL